MSFILSKKDKVCSFDVIRKEDTHIFVVSVNGKGKLTPITAYGLMKSRRVKGYQAMTLDGKDRLLKIFSTSQQEMLTLSTKDKTISLEIAKITVNKARRTKGVRLIKSKEKLIAAGKWKK